MLEKTISPVVQKLLHTLLTDTENVFLGFANACVSAGRVGCKLLTLMRDGVTGKEVKRFIEDSHDVNNQPNTLPDVFP